MKEIKIKNFKEKHERNLAESREKERQQNIEEKCLREQVRQLESQKLRIKVECEEKFKSFYQELTRYAAQGKIYQKEAEYAKDQLRHKVMEILQIEAKHRQNLEEMGQKRQEELIDAKLEKVSKKNVDLEQEIQTLNYFLQQLQNSFSKYLFTFLSKSAVCLHYYQSQLFVYIFIKVSCLFTFFFR